MAKEILCGSACVKYVLDYYQIPSNNIDVQMYWVFELAKELLNHGLKVKVACHNSALYNDYKLGNNKELFKSIKVIEEPLTKNNLIDSINHNDFVIICVKSSIFNSNQRFNGGHFIIATDVIGDNVAIINPIKNKYEKKIVSLDFIIACVKTYGSWRIMINR